MNGRTLLRDFSYFGLIKRFLKFDKYGWLPLKALVRSNFLSKVYDDKICPVVQRAKEPVGFS